MMKSNSNASGRSLGLLAHGSAGDWQVEIDEASSGEPRWFMQIGGPARYLYFPIAHPRVIDSILCFIGGFDESCSSHSAPPQSQLTELCLGDCDGNTAALLRDEGENDHCTFLVTGPGEMCVRISLTDCDTDLISLIGALRELRHELDEAGALATASIDDTKHTN